MRRIRRRLLAWAGAAALGLAAPLAAWASHGSGAPAVIGLRSDYVMRLLDERERLTLVDLRKTSEYRAGHLPGAISLPIVDLERRFKEIPKTERVVLYCQCPAEDIASAFVFLSRQGYINHAVLEDGLDGWLRRRYPIVK